MLALVGDVWIAVFLSQLPLLLKEKAVQSVGCCPSPELAVGPPAGILLWGLDAPSFCRHSRNDPVKPELIVLLACNPAHIHITLTNPVCWLFRGMCVVRMLSYMCVLDNIAAVTSKAIMNVQTSVHTNAVKYSHALSTRGLCTASCCIMACMSAGQCGESPPDVG